MSVHEARTPGHGPGGTDRQHGPHVRPTAPGGGEASPPLRRTTAPEREAEGRPGSARLSLRGLDHLAYATRSGSRRVGPPGQGPAPRVGKRWRARFRALRRWLLHVLGPDAFDWAERLFVNGESSRELGAAVGVHATTVCRTRQRLPARLREAVLAAAGRGRVRKRRGPARAWVDKLLAGLASGALADAALAALAADPTGCTIAPRTAAPVGPTDAWAASVAGHEERHPVLTFKAVRAYALRRRKLLFGPGEVYLGAWRDGRGGGFCLDLTRLFPDPGAALAFARANGQRAVTHLRTGRTVWLDELGGGRRAA